jgi:iron(III) transport system permease protein
MSGRRPAIWNKIIRSGYPGYLHILFLFVFIAIIITPLVPLLIETIHYVLKDPAGAAGVALPSGRVFGLLVNSVILALCVAVSATVIGVLAGTWLWTNDRGIRGYLPWALLVFIPLPSTLYYFAWSSLLPLTGGISAWWIQVMMYLPLLTIFSYIGLRLVEREKIDAGRIVTPEVRVYYRVVLPLAAPLILAGSGLVFIFSMLDYTVPSLCSVNVYSLEIFAQYSANSLAAHAFLLSLPLMVIAGAGIFFSQYNMKKAFQKVSWDRSPHYTGFSWPGWFTRIIQAAIGITVLGTGFVFIFLLFSAITGQTVAMNAAMYSDVLFSFFTAILAAVLALAPAMAAAREMSLYSRWSGLWWGITMVPLAIPAALAGIGLAVVSNSSALEPFTGGIVLPVFISIFRFIPIAAIVLCAQLRITDRTLIEAGQIFSPGIIREWTKVRLPLFFPGIFMAAYLVFAFTLGELGGTIMIIPPGSSTLTIRLYNYLHYGASGSVAQLSLLLAGLVLLSGVVFLLVLGALRRSHTHEHAKHEEGVA